MVINIYVGVMKTSEMIFLLLCRNSDGWQKGVTNVPPCASRHSAALKALLIVVINVCLRQRRSGGKLLQLQNTEKRHGIG